MDILRKILVYLLSTDLFIRFYLRIQRKRPRIILYHGVPEHDYEKMSFWFVTREAFKKQIEYLKKYYVDVPLSRLITARECGELLPNNGITITFDDGYESNYKYALPVLLKHGFTASVFISPKYTEMAQRSERIVLWWNVIDYVVDVRNCTEFISIFNAHGISLPSFRNIQSLKLQMCRALRIAEVDVCEKIAIGIKSRFSEEIEAERFPKMMNWQQVKELKKMGMEIGVHTMSHVTASRLPLSQFHHEFVESKNILEDKVNDKVETFAFPYGGRAHYSPEAVDALKKAGYKCALLVLGGNDKEEKDTFCLNRTPITRDDSFRTFKLKAAGIYDVIIIIYRHIKSFFKSCD